MSRLVLYIAASLDGFIADKEGRVGWLEQFDSPEYGYEDFVAGVDTLIMGRVTYEQTLTFGPWPYTGKRVIVMTRRALQGAPPGVEAWQGDDVVPLLSGITGDAWLVGGAESARVFLERGLVDTLRLFVIPTLLGDGIRLFQNVRATLRLAACRRYSTGVVELEYGR